MELSIVLEEEDGSELGTQERDARYARDNFLREPHCEPVTIKLTPSVKERLREFVDEEGYTNLGAAIRELILIGLNFYPVAAFLDSETRQNKYRDHPLVKKYCL